MQPPEVMLVDSAGQGPQSEPGQRGAAGRARLAQARERHGQGRRRHADADVDPQAARLRRRRRNGRWCSWSTAARRARGKTAGAIAGTRSSGRRRATSSPCPIRAAAPASARSTSTRSAATGAASAIDDLMAGLAYLEKLPYIDTDAHGRGRGVVRRLHDELVRGQHRQVQDAHHPLRRLQLRQHVRHAPTNSGSTNGSTAARPGASANRTKSTRRTASPRSSRRRCSSSTTTSTSACRSARAISCSRRSQRLGVPSKMINFPDEGHWVAKPANSAYWHKEVFAWLAKYVPPGGTLMGLQPRMGGFRSPKESKATFPSERHHESTACWLRFVSVVWPSSARLAAPATASEFAATASDSCLVYVGTYTGAKSKGVYAYRLDEKRVSARRSAWSPRSKTRRSWPCIRVASFCTRSTRSAISTASRPAASARLPLDTASGKLALLNQQSSRGAGPCHLVVDSAGHDGAGGQLRRRQRGFAAHRRRRQARSGRIVHSAPRQRRQSRPARGVRTRIRSMSTPNNRFAMAADLGLDKVLVYRLDPATSKLTANDPPSAAVPPGSGPAPLRLSSRRQVRLRDQRDSVHGDGLCLRRRARQADASCKPSPRCPPAKD